MPTFCIGYENTDALRNELEKKLKELYTPAHVDCTPRVDCGYEEKSCSLCSKNGGCCGWCMKPSIETRLEQLGLDYEIALRYAAEQAEQFARVAKQIADLEARISRIEALYNAPAQLIGEPLYPFNLRNELLRMQIWRLQEGTAPIDAGAIGRAIKYVDDALAPAQTAGKRSDSGRY